MKLSDFQALSFDCYGTLIDWEAGIAGLLATWARGQGLDVGDEQLLEIYAVHEAAAEASAPMALYPEILAKAMASLAEQLGVAASPAEVQRFAASVPDWPTFPDSPEALASLASQYTLIILSNVDRASFAASNARLGVTFDAIITAQDVGSYKPSPRNFEALLERATAMGVAPGKLLHVAQSLFHDHIPAKSLGLSTVWINRRHGREGGGATPPPQSQVNPDWTFSSMAEFAAGCRRAGAEVTSGTS